MAREIFYTFNASAPPPDPTVNSTRYTTPLIYPVGGGYYKAIAREEGIITAVTSKSFERAPTDYIAYYPFSGNTLDVSGSGYNLTNNGATLTTDRNGSLNSAYSFDGINDYMDMPSILQSSNSFSYFCEFNIGVLNNWMRLFDFGNGTSNYFFFAVNTKPALNNKPRFGIKNGGIEQIVICPNTLSINTWYRICIIFDSVNNLLIIYLNGSLMASGMITIKPSDIGTTTSNYIGKSQYPDPYFNGIIDEIKIFNRALTEQEAIALTTE